MLQALLHAAINVSDLEASEHFYGTVLCLTRVERALSFPGAWYQLGNFQIHLIVAKQHFSHPTSTEKWGRRGHLAFAIADLAQAKERLAAANIPMQPSASGRAAIFVHDPDGYVIELSQI